MISRASLAFVCLAFGLVAPALARAADQGRTDARVTLAEDDASFTLANGQLTARIDKRSGTFTLKLGDLDVIDRGYWSQVGRSGAGDIARFSSQRSSAVRIDPKTNNGERAEVSCRFGYDGKSPGL